MGLGGKKGRPHVARGLAIAAILLLSLTMRARAAGDATVPMAHPTPPPTACASPLSAPTSNPACASPRPAATIHGLDYIDTNENGHFEPREATVEGYAVHLQRADWAEPWTVEPVSGYYCFEGLAPGDYTLTVTLSIEDQRVLVLLDEAPEVISLQDGEAVVRDFRYARYLQDSTPPAFPTIPAPTPQVPTPEVPTPEEPRHRLYLPIVITPLDTP